MTTVASTITAQAHCGHLTYHEAVFKRSHCMRHGRTSRCTSRQQKYVTNTSRNQAGTWCLALCCPEQAVLSAVPQRLLVGSFSVSTTCSTCFTAADVSLHPGLHPAAAAAPVVRVAGTASLAGAMAASPPPGNALCCGPAAAAPNPAACRAPPCSLPPGICCRPFGMT